MRRRRTAVAVLAAATLGAAPVPAQTTPAAKTVVGGPTFNSAPVLIPGSYRDSILPGEVIFYGIRLQAGQALRTTLTTQADKATFDAAKVQDVRTTVYTPQRQRVGDFASIPGETEFLSGPDDRALRQTAPVGTLREETASSPGDYNGPGLYFFAVAAATGNDDLPPRVELPVTFSLAVVGAPVAEAPTKIVKPREASRPGPGTGSEDDSPPYALAGVLALLAGALAGAALALRRRS